MLLLIHVRRHHAHRPHAGAAGRFHVVYRVANVKRLLRGKRHPGGVQDGEGVLQREGVRLTASLLLLPRDQQGEVLLPAEAVERPLGLRFWPARDDAHDAAPLPELSQGLGFDERRLLGDEAVPVLAAVAFLKLLHHPMKRHFHAAVGDNGMRQLPVVVKATDVLVALHEAGRDLAAGEMEDGLLDSPPVGPRYIDEHAVHVKQHGLDGNVRKHTRWLH